MAFIREVLKNSHNKKWAYVEHSDENEQHFVILGGKEFDTKEEATEWSRKFEPFSYVTKEETKSLCVSFEDAHISSVTKRWRVRDKDNFPMGMIFWDFGFKEYIFVKANPNSTFTSQALLLISNFLLEKRIERIGEEIKSK